MLYAAVRWSLMAHSGHSRHRNNLSAFGQERTNSGALLARVIGSYLYISSQFGLAPAPQWPQRSHRSLGPHEGNGRSSG
jgi:hypothetical protein